MLLYPIKQINDGLRSKRKFTKRLTRSKITICFCIGLLKISMRVGPRKFLHCPRGVFSRKTDLIPDSVVREALVFVIALSVSFAAIAFGKGGSGSREKRLQIWQKISGPLFQKFWRILFPKKRLLIFSRRIRLSCVWKEGAWIPRRRHGMQFNVALYL
jgi:hypothetical protein